MARAPGLGPGGRRFESCHPDLCGCSSMVEHQPSKLDTWVRFPSPALVQGYRSGHNEAVLKTVCPQGRVGSNPTPCAFFCLKTDMQKKTKKFLTNEKHFDRINKLSQDRELKTKFKKIKKCLTNEQRFDKIIKLSQESKTKNIDN